MSARFGRWAAFAALLLTAQLASAEPTDAAPDTSNADSSDAAAADDSEAPPPPSPLMLRAAASRDVLAELGMRSDAIHQWLRDARRSGYRARAACLDSLLSETHALERAADEARIAAEKAAAGGDATTVDRELVRLAVFEQRSRGLMGSAQQCGRSPIRASRPLPARAPRTGRR